VLKKRAHNLTSASEIVKNMMDRGFQRNAQEVALFSEATYNQWWNVFKLDRTKSDQNAKKP
jgi:hypothetical protein